ncbi:FAD-dependent oxidoreductase [Micromonospora sp. NBC_01638]|uniref:FAD-dependent oxidoreductase n=1 Tax=Micromonospora sp. NBC_01638 TaxID=2975982 RepID=UPI0038661C80|nr:squalene monooxygenase [Micromonospora sp. NBC_01638]
MAHARTAVVLGGSVAGLITAQVLSDRYDTVTVIDRDTPPDAALPRRGVPQSRQLHVLLARGRLALDEIFAGFSGDLTGAGAPLVDLNEEVHWFNDGYRMRRAPSDLVGVGASRPLIEHAMRARVRQLPNVELCPGIVATGLLTEADGNRVRGVTVTPYGSETVSDLPADLVVDACGRATRTPVWLAGLGCPIAREERVPVDVTYVSRFYERNSGHLGGLSGLLINAVPGRPRTGIVAVQENGRFAVALSGVLGEQPPGDDEGYARFAESLGVPELTEMIRAAVPVTEPVRMRYPESVRRRYERLGRFPRGFLVTGDALCSFNPVYGQGITVAVLQGLMLRDLFRSGGDPDWRRFFRKAARIIDGPWSISAGTDLRFSGVLGGGRPRCGL